MCRRDLVFKFIDDTVEEEFPKELDDCEFMPTDEYLKSLNECQLLYLLNSAYIDASDNLTESMLNRYDSIKNMIQCELDGRNA